MNARRLASAAIVALMGVGVFVYAQNLKLERELAFSSEHCELRASALEDRYQSKIEHLQQGLPATGVDSHAAKVDSGTKKTDFNNLVSYGHRVQALTHKYEFLLESVQLEPTDKKMLRSLLMKREELDNTLVQNHKNTMGDIENIQSTQLEIKLNDIERQIENLLRDPLDYSRYQFLKEKNI